MCVTINHPFRAYRSFSACAISLAFASLILATPCWGNPGKQIFKLGETNDDLVLVNDLNKDGVLEILAGNLHKNRMIMFDGKTGKRLYDLKGTSKKHMGTRVALYDDLDGDGIKEVAGCSNKAHGRVQVHKLSATKSKQIYQMSPGDDGHGCYALATMNDVNGDGFKELAVGIEHGTVKVYSYNPEGTDKATPSSLGAAKFLYSFNGPSGSHYGSNIVVTDDLNGDGFNDLAVGAPLAAQGDLINIGMVDLRSGRDGSPILKPLFGSTSGARFGHSLTTISDQDGDGFKDLVIGAPGVSNNAGTIYIVSSKKGTVIRELNNPGFTELGHTWVVNVGDINADNREDIAARHSKGIAIFHSRNGKLAVDHSGFGLKRPLGLGTHYDGNDLIFGAYIVGGKYAFLGNSYGCHNVAAAPYGAAGIGTGGFTPYLTFKGCQVNGGTFKIAGHKALSNVPWLMALGLSKDEIGTELDGTCKSYVDFDGEKAVMYGMTNPQSGSGLKKPGKGKFQEICRGFKLGFGGDYAPVFIQAVILDDGGPSTSWASCTHAYELNIYADIE